MPLLFQEMLFHVSGKADKREIFICMPLLFQKMIFHVSGKAVFIIAVCGDIICNRFGIIATIDHTDTQTAVCQHVIVIGRIAKGNDLFRCYSVTFTEFFSA